MPAQQFGGDVQRARRKLGPGDRRLSEAPAPGRRSELNGEGTPLRCAMAVRVEMPKTTVTPFVPARKGKSRMTTGGKCSKISRIRRLRRSPCLR